MEPDQRDQLGIPGRTEAGMQTPFARSRGRFTPGIPISMTSSKSLGRRLAVIPAPCPTAVPGSSNPSRPVRRRRILNFRRYWSGMVTDLLGGTGFCRGIVEAATGMIRMWPASVSRTTGPSEKTGAQDRWRGSNGDEATRDSCVQGRGGPRQECMRAGARRGDVGTRRCASARPGKFIEQ